MSGVVEDLVIPSFDFNSVMEGGTYSSLFGSLLLISVLEG